MEEMEVIVMIMMELLVILIMEEDAILQLVLIVQLQME